jgi:hypothetical protein
MHPAQNIHHHAELAIQIEVCFAPESGHSGGLR